MRSVHPINTLFLLAAVVLLFLTFSLHCPSMRYKAETLPFEFVTDFPESKVELQKNTCLFGFASPDGRYWGAYTVKSCIPHEFLWWSDEEIVLQIKTLGIQEGFKLLSVTINGEDQDLREFMEGWSKDY